MNRSACALFLALNFVALPGCVVYEPVPVRAPPLTPQERFDRSWSAAAAALTENGLTIMSQDRAAGVIRSMSGPIIVNAFVQTQADGKVEVRFETSGAKDTDPGLGQRVSASFMRRVGM